jgi:hypothetical protein
MVGCVYRFYIPEESKMVVKRKITKKYYFMTFVITTLIFAVAFLLGFFVNSLNYSGTLNELSDMKTDLLRYDLQYKLLGEYPCEYLDDNSQLGGEYEEIRFRIARLESELGKQDERVLTLKTYYSLLEINDFLYYSDLNRKCGTDYDLVLYFYSNDKEKCPSCEKQGFILDFVYEENENVRIYSFDYDLGLTEIEILKGKYGVDGVPSIVINGKLLNGFNEIESIQALI